MKRFNGAFVARMQQEIDNIARATNGTSSATKRPIAPPIWRGQMGGGWVRRDA